MITIIDHPLIKDKLSRMRKVETESTKFRDNLKEITELMVYEATKNFELNKIELTTPLAKTTGYKLKYNTVLVPILRAGLGMVDGAKELIPTASIGHLGVYRDEVTLHPKEYFCKMPDTIEGSNLIIFDPMLATGNTAIYAVNLLKKYKPRKIIFIALVSCPEGLTGLSDAHKDIDIYVAANDSFLNDKGYIVPGLGDAGDRIFGTK